MRESFWGVFIIGAGVVLLMVIYVFQSITNTDEHNYNLLKETTEAAMFDALDLAYYHNHGEIRIDREKFVESFTRRFAENANLSRTYVINIYDVNEKPPKVSLKVSGNDRNPNATYRGNGQTISFTISNRLDAILELPTAAENQEESGA